MKVKDLIFELSKFNPDDEINIAPADGQITGIVSGKKKEPDVIEKTEMCKSLSEYSVEKLQSYLHKTSLTDEEKMDLIVFERILKRTDRVGKAYELLKKEGD